MSALYRVLVEKLVCNLSLKKGIDLTQVPPIAINSIVSKVLEQILNKQLIHLREHLRDHSRINNR